MSTIVSQNPQKPLEAIDPEKWRTELKQGSNVDAQDSEGIWIPARVLSEQSSVQGSRLQIHYLCWGNKWNEFIPRASKRLAPYGSYLKVYRFPDGFQHSDNFDASPYSHLTKEQKPIPRSQGTTGDSSFISRTDHGAKNYETADQDYKPRNPANPGGVAYKYKFGHPPKGRPAPAYKPKPVDQWNQADLVDATNRSRAMSELENDKQLLIMLFESENMGDEKSAQSPPQVQQKIEWVCGACTMWNDAATTRCKTCETRKPAPTPAPTPAPSQKSSQTGKLAEWHKKRDQEVQDENKALAIEEGEQDVWRCRSCTYDNKKDAQKCKMCSDKKPLPFKGPEDYDPLGDEDADLTFKSDIWYLRWAVKKDNSDIMEKFLKFVFVNDKSARERSFVWAAKNDSVNCIITLLEHYRPHINLQAAPLFYAVKNQNEHLCSVILDEMEKRKGEKYTVMSMCFKEIIKADMVDIGERVLRSHFYRPTEVDFELARKVGGLFEDKLLIRDPKGVIMDDNDGGLDIDDWSGDDDVDDDDDDEYLQDFDEAKHSGFDDELKHDTEMSDFESLPNPMDLVQSATEDEAGDLLVRPKFSDSEFSEIDVGMESDQSFVLI